MDGLIKQYRRLAGHISYLERHPAEDQGPFAGLCQAHAALTGALKLCAADLDVTALRAIPYHPSSALPGTALIRAVLAHLRIAAEAVTTDQLITALVCKHAIRFHTDTQKRRFEKRVCSCVGGMAKRRILRQSPDGRWCV